MLEFVRLLEQVSSLPVDLEDFVDHLRPFVLCCYPGLHEVRMLTNQFQAQHRYLLPTATVFTLNSTVWRLKSNAAICKNDSEARPGNLCARSRINDAQRFSDLPMRSWNKCEGRLLMPRKHDSVLFVALADGDRRFRQVWDTEQQGPKVRIDHFHAVVQLRDV